MECKVFKARAKDKDKPKYGRKHYKNKFKGLNLLQSEAANQKSKYEKSSKTFTKKKTSKKETVVLDDYFDSNS